MKSTLDYIELVKSGEYWNVTYKGYHLASWLLDSDKDSIMIARTIAEYYEKMYGERIREIEEEIREQKLQKLLNEKDK